MPQVANFLHSQRVALNTQGRSCEICIHLLNTDLIENVHMLHFQIEAGRNQARFFVK